MKETGLLQNLSMAGIILLFSSTDYSFCLFYVFFKDFVSIIDKLLTQLKTTYVAVKFKFYSLISPTSIS